MIIKFPDASSANEDGIVCVGGDISAENLIGSYKKGIFPWPHYDDPYPVLWFSPDPRGILFLENFHISKSLKKFLKKESFTFSMNKCFQDVIKNCQKSSTRAPGTWITESLIKGYEELFREGGAYSIEVWSKSGELVGGLYGVCMGNFYSAESMFFIESQASKCAIVYLYDFLLSKNIKWLDIQMVTPITESFGGEEISRSEFIRLVKQVL